MNKGSFKNSLLLFLAAFIWGVAFVSQSKGMEYMGPFTFNGVRSLIGAIVLVPVILFRYMPKKAANGSETLQAEAIDNQAGACVNNPWKQIDWKTTLTGGICCGLALMIATTVQQIGIMYTTVGKAGFITALYIIFVPIFGIFIGKKVPGAVWIGAVMAAVGMYLLCIQGSFRIGLGDTLIFICAVVFTIHILVIDHFSPKTDGVMLSCIQFFICGIICTTIALIVEQPDFSQLVNGAVPILYAGVMSCGVAYTLQIVGQKGVNPTIAALILSLESVVSVLAGWFAYKIGFLKDDQTLTGRQLLGCAIVFAAVILVQLPVGEIIGKIKGKNKKDNN